MVLLYVAGGIAGFALLAYFLKLKKDSQKSQDYQNMVDKIMYSDEYKVKGRFDTR